MRSFLKSLKRQDGFTLVELMVVVAIIGVLSAVAIPNFKKYQAKAKSSEAKLQLSAVYTAQQSFFSDYGIYHFCLKYMGFDPANEVASRYYTVGFNTDTAIETVALANAVTSGLSTAAGACVGGANLSSFVAGKRVVSSVAPAAISELSAAATNADQSTPALLAFVAGAAGFISADTIGANTSSLFTINQNKLLVGVRPGY